MIDQVLAAVLPQYRRNLEQPAKTQPPAAVPAPPSVPSALVASWTGAVDMPRGPMPLSVTIDPTGALVAKLGTQPEVRLKRPRLGVDVIRWTMPGSLGAGDEPFDLAMRLYLYGDVLAGAARTNPKPSTPDASWVYYWVRLEKASPAK